MDATFGLMDMLWMGGLAATPLAILVGAACRVRSMRPATRHMLWLCVLLSFLTPAVGTVIWHPAWFASGQVMAAAERVLDDGQPVAAGAKRGVSRHGDRGQEKRPLDASVASAGMKSEELEGLGGAGEAGLAHGLERDGSVEEILKNFDAARELAERAIQRAEAAKLGQLRNPSDEGGLSAGFSGNSVLPGSWSAETSGPEASKSIDAGVCEEAGFSAVSARDELGGFKGWMHDERGALDRAGVWNGLGGSAARTSPGLGEVIERRAEGDGPISKRGSVREGVRGGVRGGVRVSSTADQVRPWLSGVLAARDSIAEAPPLPLAVWGGVACVLIAVTVVRAGRTAWWLRRARPAADSQRELVNEVARRMGIVRTPRTLLVDDAVSPMIWCGVRPKLILPSGLWRTLDDASRRAVVAHELAHLRRGDHRVCWVEGLIGALYWWHPVVWWARWRMRDAAEASCDAWVMEVMPQSRRAYASALVTTKSFLSSQQHAAGPCLGIMSGSAKRLARRITMVMTQKTAPRPSVMGACLATIVLAAGMFVTPGLACPPEEGGQKAQGAEKAAQKAAQKAGKTTAKSLRVLTGRATSGQQAGEQAAAHAGQTQPDGVVFFGEAPALEAMKAQGGNPVEGQGVQVEGRAAQSLGGFMTQVERGTPSATVFGQPSAAATWNGVDLEALKVGRTPRAYVLSNGKLDAFYEFMSRNDVPVLVSREGNAIVIWATDAQHPVVKSFVEMVDPNARSKAVKGAAAGGGGQQRAKASRDAAEAQRAGAAAAREAHRGAMREYERAMREVEQNRARVEAEADRMREKADQSREQAEELHGLSAELAERAAQQADQSVRAALEAAQSQLKSRSKQLEGQSGQLERQLELMNRKLRELESRMDQLNDKLSQAMDEEMEALAMLEDQVDVDVDVDVDVPEVVVDTTEGGDVMIHEDAVDTVEGEDVHDAPDAPDAPDAEDDVLEAGEPTAAAVRVISPQAARVIDIAPTRPVHVARIAPMVPLNRAVIMPPAPPATLTPTAPVLSPAAVSAPSTARVKLQNTTAAPKAPLAPAAPSTFRVLTPTTPTAPTAPTAPAAPAPIPAPVP
ncbi:MAG TPA: M56 family metallopeptidase, partial [Phycisphaerales bacterium]|nr:M56 family metallopeptidase [Phycisphaerales bacterium]